MDTVEPIDFRLLFLIISNKFSIVVRCAKKHDEPNYDDKKDAYESSPNPHIIPFYYHMFVGIVIDTLIIVRPLLLLLLLLFWGWWCVIEGRLILAHGRLPWGELLHLNKARGLQLLLRRCCVDGSHLHHLDGLASSLILVSLMLNHHRLRDATRGRLGLSRLRISIGSILLGMVLRVHSILN